MPQCLFLIPGVICCAESLREMRLDYYGIDLLPIIGEPHFYLQLLKHATRASCMGAHIRRFVCRVHALPRPIPKSRACSHAATQGFALG
jgi:hypothetical protein